MEEDVKYKILERRIKEIQDSLDRIDSDLASDRKDFDQMKIHQQTILNQQKVILETLARAQGKTKEAINDAVEDAIQPVQDTLDSFVKNKTRIIRQEVRVGLFGRIFNKIKRGDK